MALMGFTTAARAGRRLHFALLALALAATAALAPATAAAQVRPTASPEISGSLGNYLPDWAHAGIWEVHLRWSVGCPGGDFFPWEVSLLDRRGGSEVINASYSSVPDGAETVWTHAEAYPYEVTPYIVARCVVGSDSSLRVEYTGAPITIPPGTREGTGEGGDGSAGGGTGGGETGGGGTGGGGGGGTGRSLPAHCDNPILGDSLDNVLVGTPANDALAGFGGNDQISGRAGADCLVGHAGGDQLAGDAGPDLLDGSMGNDVLAGGAGADSLYGGSGRDRLLGEGGANALYGGRGNDTLSSANGRRDVVDCGPGRRDLAQVDGLDRVRGCERKVRA